MLSGALIERIAGGEPGDENRALNIVWFNAEPKSILISTGGNVR
jgi:hypothetical protein